MSVCLGHLKCCNPECDFLKRVHKLSEFNETEWKGTSPILFMSGERPANSTVACAICLKPPTCIGSYQVRIYYVFGENSMSRACVHLGSHTHSVKTRIYRESAKQLKKLNGEQVERTSTATYSSIISQQRVPWGTPSLSRWGALANTSTR